LLTPTLTAHTDHSQGVTTVAVTGPVINREQAATLRSASLIGPETHGLVLNLTGVSLLAEVGLEALRELSRTCAARQQHVVFVCSELMLRSELILADLDTLAPVLATEEEAVLLLGDVAAQPAA
jgi:anti-anti-sigma regulatory factor